jgi:dipeptidyl aminopeptidase/acylaminoacyl peptidase
MAGRTEFSRDGARVAWVSTSDGGLWQSRVDGSQRFQLTSRPMHVFMMRWSPDARSIAFMGKEPGKTWKIYTILAEGGQPQIVSEEPRSQADPDWSPDGRYLVAMPLDQRKLMLFEIASKQWTGIATGRFNNPVWSKDGKYIYYQTYDEGSPICRIPVAGGRVEEIAGFRDLAPGTDVSYWGVASPSSPVVSFDFFTADIYSVNWAHR